MALTVARVVHVLGAALWVGGTVFIVAVAVPFARTLPDQQRTATAAAIGRRFRPVGYTALAALVLSGLYMLWKLGYTTDLTGTADGRLMLVKLVGVAVLIVLSAVHDFVLGPRAERGEPTRGVLVVLARSSGVLTLIVPVIGVLLAH
jgi:putative copper export protein